MFTLLQEDWRALGLSERSRGLGDGNAIARALSQAFGLLVLSIRRATKLATAMEARGFGSGAPRSQARIWRLKPIDWIFYVILSGRPAGPHRRSRRHRKMALRLSGCLKGGRLAQCLSGCLKGDDYTVPFKVSERLMMRPLAGAVVVADWGGSARPPSVSRLT